MAIQHKVIRLVPANWHLDVFLGGTKDERNELMLSLFGIPDELPNADDYVHVMQSTKRAQYKGHKRIILVVEKLDAKVVVHEMMHVLWRANVLIGYEMNYESQEWQATFMEYLFVEIMDKKGYMKI